MLSVPQERANAKHQSGDVWTTKHAKRHEKRESLSCLSRSFVTFVVQDPVARSMNLTLPQGYPMVRQAHHKRAKAQGIKG